MTKTLQLTLVAALIAASAGLASVAQAKSGIGSDSSGFNADAPMCINWSKQHCVSWFHPT
jgi:hypothetical protein